METRAITGTRPFLKTKGFSTLHIDIFLMILRGKTNREINNILGYTQRSHVVVDHSRKVMFKLLALESLTRLEHAERVIYPRNYKFWWKNLFDTHGQTLLSIAKEAAFYEDTKVINDRLILNFLPG